VPDKFLKLVGSQPAMPQLGRLDSPKPPPNQRSNAMPATRRVVTAVNDDGKSYFAIDEPTPHVFDFGAAQFHEIWADAGNLQPSQPLDKLSSDKTALNPPRRRLHHPHLHAGP
jgi:hypothetical protein